LTKIPDKFPEITFPDPATVPPIVFPNDPSVICTPCVTLGTTPVPPGLVPIRFPWIKVLVTPTPLSAIPAVPFPEITLPAPEAVPPMVVPLDAPATTIPDCVLRRSEAPVTSVPM